jgi:hypothetical protein
VVSAALILPISEAIGQLKWTWFQGDTSKEMIDFEIFDKASRGAWGSFLLLFRTKGRSLAALGAALTLLLLATDTFFQQVIHYPDLWALEHLGSAIPRVVRYQPFYTPEYYQGMETNFNNPALRPIVGSYMVDNGTQPIQSANGTKPDIPLSCPSSNCTWPEYETLGICSECVEVSDLLEHACIVNRVDWSQNLTGPIQNTLYPNKTVCGYFLNLTSSTPVLMSGYVVDDSSNFSSAGEVLLVHALPLTDMIKKSPLSGGSINFQHIRNPILDAVIASASDGVESVLQNKTPVAHECVLTWCVKTIRSSYAWGDYKEDVASRFLNNTIGPWPWEAYPVYMEGENGTMTIYSQEIDIYPPADTSSDSLSANARYGLDNTTASNVMGMFDDFFPSSYTAKTPTELPMLRYKNYLDGPSLRKLVYNPLLAPNNVTHHMQRFALALTNAIRSDVDSNEMVSGLAYNKKQFVIVRWWWLLFPFALLLLSLIFLVATVIRTSKDSNEDLGVWKTSAMPTLIYSLPKEVQRKLRERDSEECEAAGETKKVKIQLLPGQGWRVSGQILKSPTSSRGQINQPPPGWI